MFFHSDTGSKAIVFSAITSIRPLQKLDFGAGSKRVSDSFLEMSIDDFAMPSPTLSFGSAVLALTIARWYGQVLCK